MQKLTKTEDLSNLLISGFTEWKQLGEVNVRLNEDGNLALFNYSDLCTFQRRWNWFERVSRGLILHTRTGEVVARPFDKFFNWGELEEKPRGLPTEVAEKCDGSLGILYRHDPHGYGGDCTKVATRGSFNSEQALWATEYLKKYDLEDLPNEFTLLFEIIYPTNRIIVDYGLRQDLVLIGVRDRFTGYDYCFSEVREIARTFGFSVPEIMFEVPMEDLLLRAECLPVNQEGWVCRFSDGSRAKVKGKEYMEMARTIRKMTDRFIFKSLSEKGYEETMMNSPEEFHPRVVECWEIFHKVEKRLYDQVMEALGQISGLQTRKEMAFYLKAQCPNLLSWVMSEYDGRSCLPQIKYHIMKEYRRYLAGE